jgi:hypothetical protein
MSVTLKKNWPLLLLLEKVTPKLRGQLLSGLAESDDFCKIIEEIYTNVIKGNLQLPKAADAKVRAKKKLCLCLSTLRKSTKSKRKLALKQSGGFLPILLPLIWEILQ